MYQLFCKICLCVLCSVFYTYAFSLTLRKYSMWSEILILSLEPKSASPLKLEALQNRIFIPYLHLLRAKISYLKNHRCPRIYLRSISALLSHAQSLFPVRIQITMGGQQTACRFPSVAPTRVVKVHKMKP